jgi:hypothetical protein
MAGTMPHAIFVETGLDDGTTAAAYAAELPGCAVFATEADAAAAAMPRRVAEFGAWLHSRGEEAPEFVGDNWYEVERAEARSSARATFSLDELPPSAEEFGSYLRWLELAREELADAVDAAPDATALLAPIERQDRSFAADMGQSMPPPEGELIDRLYAARDALTAALEAAGPSAEGVRRILRVGIADDLRLADRLRRGLR